MFKNYFISTLRNTLRNKLYTAINIFGLAIGLSACLLILLVVRHEFSYDNFIPNSENIYRIETTANIPGRSPMEIGRFVGPTKELLPPDYPEVKEVLRIAKRSGSVVVGAEQFEQEIDYVDDNFFKLFQLPLIEGNYDSAFSAPSNVVISLDMAKKYLGEGPYVGREIIIDQTYQRTHIVSAVMENIPANSHLALSMMVTHDRRAYGATDGNSTTELEQWNALPFYVYILLNDGASIEPLKNTINAWIDRNFPSQIAALVNIPGSQLWTPHLMPVQDIHLFSNTNGNMKPQGSITMILSFGAIAALILIIASINFMNLATARATLRAREVAVRKVMGAKQSQLFMQFETESMLFTLAALFLAVFLTELILPIFNDYTQLNVPFSLILDPLTLLYILILILIVGLGAGLHPALVLSSLRPSRILMSNQSSSSGNSKLRSALVVLQFTISAVLIIGTLLIYFQTDFARSRELGYSPHNKIIVSNLNDPRVQPSQEAFKSRVSQLKGVKAVALSSTSPGGGYAGGGSFKLQGESERLIINFFDIDQDLFNLYEVKPVAGRLFSKDYPADILYSLEVPGTDPNSDEVIHQDTGAIINVTATKRLGFENPADAIGFTMYRGANDEVTVHIVGVIPDILYSNLRDAVSPQIYFYSPQSLRVLNVAFDTENFAQTEAISHEIEAIWSEMFPEVRYSQNYLEDNIALNFRGEDVMGRLLTIFSGLAILVASMGLFALSSFTVVRRTKEIGIRKVLGATSTNIISLLVRQMSWPVIIANILAWPIGWLVISKWLEGYFYRIELLPYFIVVAGISIMLTLFISWLTTGGHALKVARTSPIFALRYE